MKDKERRFKFAPDGRLGRNSHLTGIMEGGGFFDKEHLSLQGVL